MIRVNTERTQNPADHRYIQDSVLNRTLTKLREEELVQRSRESAFPYHTTYRITASGRGLLDALLPLARWAEQREYENFQRLPRAAPRRAE
ncbi:winged helix-turn-helix transcriptional regulator [Streptomyces sp. NPDC059010]|uniref:winged helix-turn-helix transcriptional regulator n=1 Tax=Streptomyces sp. NPDC059010 TaxID=3346695 RepID=UPI0036A4D4E7